MYLTRELGPGIGAQPAFVASGLRRRSDAETGGPGRTPSALLRLHAPGRLRTTRRWRSWLGWATTSRPTAIVQAQAGYAARQRSNNCSAPTSSKPSSACTTPASSTRFARSWRTSTTRPPTRNTLSKCNELRDDYKTADKAMADADALPRPTCRKVWGPAPRTRPWLRRPPRMLAELQPDILPRLDAFLGQARQAERQRRQATDAVDGAGLAAVAGRHRLAGRACLTRRRIGPPVSGTPASSS